MELVLQAVLLVPEQLAALTTVTAWLDTSARAALLRPMEFALPTLLHQWIALPMPTAPL